MRYVHRFSRFSLKMSSRMNWDPNSAPKLDFDEDYYSVLETDPKIDAMLLKKAYYVL